MSINSRVEQLVDEGRYAEAAKIARSSGDPTRAAELYEQIWSWPEAAACAREAGDLPRALASAIEARDEALVSSLVDALQSQGDDGRTACMLALAKGRRFDGAAQIAESLGEWNSAIDYYLRAHRDLDAARLLEQEGRDREAGRLYERVIDEGGGTPELARAHLRLGTLLARRMQHESATRHLQEAARHDETRDEARRLLVLELAALGLRDAARDVLSAARRDDVSISPDLDRFLRAQRGAERAQATERADKELIGGRYRIETLLGAGASGRVFKARDEVTGRVVAIKLLHATHARGQQAYERFVREAKVASSLHHQNLVEVYEFSGDLGFITMEYMVGGSLEQRLGSPMPATKVRRLMLDLLAGLEIAHQRGIIHRDVKPANIFFDARGTAKLGDFGVAHLLDLGQTQTGGLIGTLAYMSPEQITGARLTITADLYAIGVTLFEALTGRRPFLGPDFVAQHLGETPPAPTSIADDVTPDWDPIVARLLTKDPSARYDSIESLTRAIESVDLSDDAQPHLLILPRARKLGDPPPREQPRADVADITGESEMNRYQFETPLGRTETSTLLRAVDVTLNRSVIIERVDAPLDEAEERRVYALARGGGPFVQRTLAYDRDACMLVYEAPSGEPIADAVTTVPLTPRAATRVLKRLARGVAPLHAAGRAHGAITPAQVVLDEYDNPTILVAGLHSTGGDGTPAHDVDAIMKIMALTLHVDATVEDVAGALVRDANTRDRVSAAAIAELTDGERLYEFAHAIEITLLETEEQTGAL